MAHNPLQALGDNLDLLHNQFPQFLRSIETPKEITEAKENDIKPVGFDSLLKIEHENPAQEPSFENISSRNYSHAIKSMRKSYMTRNDNFKVCVRIRPLDENEKRHKNGKNADANICLNNDEYSIKLKEDKLVYDYAGKHSQGFYYDYVFGSALLNQYVFEQSLQPMLTNIFDGFNVTCMAYGITGAGKTYTMLGNTMNSTLGTKQVKGISELAMDYIFEFIKRDSNKTLARGKEKNNVKYKIKISYLEVYNEHIRDLLREDKPINLIILEDAKHGIIVPGLKECEVHSSLEVISLINKGNNRRTMASTYSNKFSSRSHAIIQISMERTQFTNVVETGNTSPKSAVESSSVYSKLTLVDLAGSEKEDQED